MTWVMSLFKKKIIIPLTVNGKKNGQWIECYKGDDIYQKLVMRYGEPLPKQIEVTPFESK